MTFVVFIMSSINIINSIIPYFIKNSTNYVLSLEVSQMAVIRFVYTRSPVKLQLCNDKYDLIIIKQYILRSAVASLLQYLDVFSFS